LGKFDTDISLEKFELEEFYMAKNDSWNKLKNEHLERLINYLTECGEEVQQYGSNKIGYPICNDEGDEGFFVITLSKPVGTRDKPTKEIDPFDGYAEAEAYKYEKEQKEKKSAKLAAEKAEKIRRDEKLRQKKAEISKKKQ
jgi:hypothetical protein